MWLQEQSLQVRFHIAAMEQEINCAQHAKKYWFTFDDKYTKCFQLTAIICKRKNYIWKILNENDLWSDDQNAILQVFARELNRRFKKDHIYLLIKLYPFGQRDGGDRIGLSDERCHGGWNSPSSFPSKSFKGTKTWRYACNFLQKCWHFVKILSIWFNDFQWSSSQKF